MSFFVEVVSPPQLFSDTATEIFNAIAKDFKIESINPDYIWKETDQVAPAGLFKARAEGNEWLFQKSLTGEFTTTTPLFKVTTSGTLEFTAAAAFTATVTGTTTFTNLVVNGTSSLKDVVTLEDNPVELRYRNTGFAVNAGGLWRTSLTDQNFRIQRNDAVGGDFSSFTGFVSFNHSAGDITQISTTFTDVVRLTSTPRLLFVPGSGDTIEMIISGGIWTMNDDITDVTLMTAFPANQKIFIGNVSSFSADLDALDARSNSISDDAVAATTTVHSFIHTNTGAVANNIGVGINFITETTTAGTHKIGALFQMVATDATAAAYTSRLDVQLVTSAGALTNSLQLTTVLLSVPASTEPIGADLTGNIGTTTKRFLEMRAKAFVAFVNSALTIGSLGSMIAPYKSDVTANAPVDADFGNLNSAFGFFHDTTLATFHLRARINGTYRSVALV